MCKSYNLYITKLLAIGYKQVKNRVNCASACENCFSPVDETSTHSSHRKQTMTIKKLNRREFLWGLSQSALTSLVLARTLQRVAASDIKPSVLVLGAGLSGLYTALLLEAKGLAVTVVEARDRVGGRVHTLDDLPGKPEAGGQSFNEKYQRLLTLAKQLQVPVEAKTSLDKELLLYVRGQSVLTKDWAASAANQLAESERSVIPPQLLTYYLNQNNPLSDAEAWTKPDYAYLDIPLDKYVRDLGASQEALRLMNFNPSSFINSIETTSALWGLRNAQRAKNPSKQALHIEGGNSRLPEKMAAALKSPVQTNKVVVCIRSRDTGVEVNCLDGSNFQADYAVVTLPFSVLRHVKIDPPLQGAQAEAVGELQYTTVTEIFLSVRESFWESDGYPPSMWTDTQLQSIFPNRDATGRILGLTCFVDGASAQELDAMSPEVLASFVKSELGRIRPAAAANVEIARVVSWGRDPFARGDYSHFGPGQIRRFQNKMAQPWKRIHFAGEHTAIASPGMESALESAERVASEILDRIG